MHPAHDSVAVGVDGQHRDADHAPVGRLVALPQTRYGERFAMEFYGGVPELLVPDNPKALIAKADRYEPMLGNTTQDFVNHYASAMLPARPCKPQDKAKVEVNVQIVERWILARLRNRRLSLEFTDMVKRPMYGLAGFQLLRTRVLNRC